jgi:hypothetical protein
VDSEALYQELAATTGALCYEDFIREEFGARHPVTVAEAKVNVKDLMPAFLPETLNGKLVLIQEKGNHYRVDNTQLQSKGPGVGYRLSKDVNDRLPEARGVAWGTVIEGTSEGDGWIRVATVTTRDDYSGRLSECSTSDCASLTSECDALLNARFRL